MLYPGWRGQNNDWEAYGKDYKGDYNTNLAIKGLFSPVSEAEEEALLADGYQKVAWGSVLVDNYDEYYTYLFYQFDSSKAPIWNCDLPSIIHAFQMNGLYSLRPSHSRSFAVLRRDFFHSGRALMECSLMVFSIFSMARS